MRTTGLPIVDLFFDKSYPNKIDRLCVLNRAPIMPRGVSLSETNVKNNNVWLKKTSKQCFVFTLNTDLCRETNAFLCVFYLIRVKFSMSMKSYIFVMLSNLVHLMILW